MKRVFDKDGLWDEIEDAVYTEEIGTYKDATNHISIISVDDKFYEVKHWSTAYDGGFDSCELDEVTLTGTEQIVTEKQIWEVVKDSN